ncbi:MAG: PGF-CTERM sorting domain-containing protein [Methanothrix sp.]|jgi:PGF-CTERM protein|nr:PGF-CTERM sorting domain-containing protein [Methanothrix sp.]
MKTWSILLAATLIALISTASAQNPLDAVAGSLQDQVNSAGSQLQQKAVQHALEGNLTQEHLTQDLNAAREEIVGEAAGKINQNLNLTAQQLQEQVQQKAKEELQNQVNQAAKQPGFEGILAIAGILAVALLIRRF